MLKKIAFSKEPILHVERYVVCVGNNKKDGSYHTKYHYCANLKEVKEISRKAKKGSVIEVHRATHNFIQAYFKEY